MTLGQFANNLNSEFTPGEKDYTPNCLVDIVDLSDPIGEPIIENEFIDKDIAPAKNKDWYKTYKQAAVKRIYFYVDMTGKGHLTLYIKA